MTANNKSVKLTIEENLETKEISISTSGLLTFPIALHLTLVALRGLKGKLDEQIPAMSREEIDKRINIPVENDTTIEDLRNAVASQMECEIYDLVNLSVSNFLDSHFPTVNARPSLTETAAKAYGLDNTATQEELLEAENKFIEEHPDEAALTSDLQPKPVRPYQEDN